jgi:phosphohistidine phosphatase
MILILLQHGEAKPETIDPERSLSEKGEQQARKAADFLKRLPFYPDLIVHSGKKRAKETAEIICFALGGIKIEERKGIGPNDDIAPLKMELLRENRTILVVGHQPFLGKLASALMEKEPPVVDLQNASPLVMAKSGDVFVIETYIKNEYMR